MTTTVIPHSELSNYELQRCAPSIFAEHPHEEVSHKYRFIPTIDVVDMLRDNGWSPVLAGENRVRRDDRRGFQKHLIRFRHRSASMISDQESLDLVLTNSHDRSAAFVFRAGVFRFVCANGMIVADSTMAKISVRHLGLEEENLITAAQTIAQGAGKVTDCIEDWKGIELSPEAQHVFAESAALTRWDEDKVPVRPDQLLQVRRSADQDNTLWTTFNRVQEGLVRGGIAAQSTNGRRRRTRAVNSVDGGAKLNTALWTLTEKMAELVTG